MDKRTTKNGLKNEWDLTGKLNRVTTQKGNYVFITETEKIALKIAHHQLESSFCIEKSIGFLNFLESRKN